MSRYWRIYRTFFRSSIIRELEFRANFFAKIAQNVVWIGFFVLVVLVIYRNTDNVAGWTRGDGFLLAAVCVVIEGISRGIFESVNEIPSQVRLGTLDFVITKPIDTQFWVTFRKFNFSQIGTILAGIGLGIFGVLESGHGVSLAQFVAFFILFTCANVMFYSLMLALMTLGIWWVRVDNIWVLGETVMGLARYPVDIFGNVLRRMFTFALPLAFVATMPASQIVRGSDWPMVALGLVWASVMFLAARKFWNHALLSYSSASS